MAIESLMDGQDVFDLLDHIPCPLAFISSDPSFKVNYVNHAFTRLFGYQMEDVKTVFDWTALVYPDTQVRQQRLSSWQTDVKKALTDHVLIPDRESHFLCKDASYRDVIVQTSILRNLLLITFTDITESKHLGDKLLESERQFRRFVENANDIIYTLDLEGNFTYLSPNYRTIFGVDPATLLGKPFSEVLHPQDLPSALESFSKVLQGTPLTGIEYRVHHCDGRWLWQSSNIGPIFDEAGHPSTVVGVGRDIHLRKQAEEKQRISEERYRLLSENARDVVWAMAPDGTITYVSPSVEQTRGYTPQETMSQPMEEILTPDSIEISNRYFGEMFADITAKRVPKTFRGEMEYLCKDGSTYWCDVIAQPILAQDGSLVELLGVSRDISQHKHYERELKQAKEAAESLNRALEAANEKLNRLATTDTLTGLWNRRHFEERITYEMMMADRYGQPLSLLLFDIDHFKIVNDTYGHLAGDQVLVELSHLVRQKIRSTDLPCRWGGEEFMILLPNTGAQEALLVAEKLRKTFANHEIAEVGITTSSFGVATYHAKETIDQWIGRIDKALYEAKNGGRNTVRFAHASP